MERPSQLILRNRDAFAAGDILLFNPPTDHLFQDLSASHSRVSIWCQDFGPYRWFGDHGGEAGFGVVPDAAGLPAQVVLFLPREKERLGLLLHFLAAGMPAGGTLWLVGENQSGIKSAAKNLEIHFSHIAKTDAARHCVLFCASQAKKAASFELQDYQQKWLLGPAGAELRMVSLPGAFAHGRLDPGTGLLLEVLCELRGSEQPHGKVLDFGCGIGLVGISLLQRDPTLDLTLLDHSALALESARLSLQANELQAALLPSDGLTEVTQRFDWIVSNPPFHRGVAMNFDVSRRFFAEAGRVLSRQGKILLVCNRHLPYDIWLGDHFSQVETLASNYEFKVLRASRPKN